MSGDVTAAIERLRATQKKATPGPWEFSDSSDSRGSKGEFRGRSPWNGFMLVGPWTNDDDTEFMVAAYNLLPTLLAEVERLRAEHERIAGDGGLLHTLQRDNVNLANERARLRAEREALHSEETRDEVHTRLRAYLPAHHAAEATVAVFGALSAGSEAHQ